MSVTVKLSDSGKLCITFPFSWDYIARIKAIKGKEWNPDEKYWNIPMKIENIQQLEEFYYSEVLNKKGVMLDVTYPRKSTNYPAYLVRKRLPIF